MATIKGILCYTAMNAPVPDFNENPVYKTALVVDKATARDWKKEFKKQPPKEVPTSEFEEKFKIPPPFPDQDDQYVINFSKKAEDKNGNPLADNRRPKLFVRNERNKLVDRKDDLRIANGSEGVVQYAAFDNDFGHFAGLVHIRVDKVIELEGFENELGEEEDGADELGDNPSTDDGDDDDTVF